MLRGLRPRRPLRRGLRRAEDGAAALEFALVGLPFFFMLFAILEIGLVFTLDAVLENATTDAGRLIRTGQATTRAMTAGQFKDEVCDRMSVFGSDCRSRAAVDVQVIPQFNAPPGDPMDDGDLQDSEMVYDRGAPGDIVVVRVFYRHPLLTPFLEEGLSRMGDGNAVLTATSAFRNEPM